jgi:hypothetical protein
MSLIEFAQVLYDSNLGTSLRESIYAFPLVEGAHLIGLAFSFGLLMFIDLRLLGVFLKSEPIQELLHSLRPWLLGGFAVTIATGILLFIATATKVILLPVFYLKLVFILLAGINAIVFELKWGKNVDDWGSDSILPSAVKYAGLASLVLWSVVIITGRLIPYLQVI